MNLVARGVALAGAPPLLLGVAIMTLWQKIKLGRDALAVWNSAEKEVTMGKSLLTSKTFWLNVIGLAVSVAEVVPPKYGVPALAVLNILMRVVTEQPITSVK
jgi:hypothetical protein